MLCQWLYDKTASAFEIGGAILLFQAEKLQQEASQHLERDRKLTLKFSNGGNELFQNCCGIKFCRVHGEALSADHEAIRRGIYEINNNLSQYAPCERWNADEFGLFFSTASRVNSL